MNIVTLENVEHFFSTVKDFPKNTKLYTRTKTEDRFLDPNIRFNNESDRRKWERDKKEFETQEITRLMIGHDGMCGKQYGFFNYAYIFDEARKGFIQPDYRVYQNEWYKAVERGKEKHRGVICTKRRQGGFSSMEHYDALHDTFLHERITVGMNSKTQTDSESFLRNMKIMFSKLPAWHRHSVISDTQEGYLFGKKTPIRREDGSKEYLLEGHQSSFYCKPPTDTAHESQTLYKWVCDEGGKIENLMQMVSYTWPGLVADKTYLQGTPIIFGTSGDIGKTGAGHKKLWYEHELYNLDQFFAGGWLGFEEYTDKYGNVDIRAAVMHILNQRIVEAKKGQKEYTDYLQKYPLTPEESFAQFGGSAKWDIARVASHKVQLEKEPPNASVGYFKRVKGKVEFSPATEQELVMGEKAFVTIYEHPIDKCVYLSGTDPINKDEVLRSKEVSDLCAYWLRAMKGTEGDNIVAKIKGRPMNLDLIYEQCAYCDEYYSMASDCKNMIENNVGERMIAWYRANEYMRHLCWQPNPIANLKGQAAMIFGFKKTVGAILRSMENETVDHIEQSCEKIPDPELCKELTDFEMNNKDCLSAYQALLLNRSNYYLHNETQIKNVSDSGNGSFTVPFKRQLVGGRLVMVR